MSHYANNLNNILCYSKRPKVPQVLLKSYSFITGINISEDSERFQHSQAEPLLLSATVVRILPHATLRSWSQNDEHGKQSLFVCVKFYDYLLCCCWLATATAGPVRYGDKDHYRGGRWCPVCEESNDTFAILANGWVSVLCWLLPPDPTGKPTRTTRCWLVGVRPGILACAEYVRGRLSELCVCVQVSARESAACQQNENATQNTGFVTAWYGMVVQRRPEKPEIVSQNK